MTEMVKAINFQRLADAVLDSARMDIQGTKQHRSCKPNKKSAMEFIYSDSFEIWCNVAMVDADLMRAEILGVDTEV